MNAPRESVHARKQLPHGSGPLIQFCETVILPSRPSDRNRQKYRFVINHLKKFIGCDPAISDLSSDNIRGTISHLVELGRTHRSIKEVRQILLAIARRAHQDELLSEVPRVSMAVIPATAKAESVKILPWPRDELQRLLASARTIPGDVGGIPARIWWSALFLVLLDTEVSVSELFKVRQSTYDATRGEVSAGLFRHQLHPLAVQSLALMLPHPYERLFPWPLDGGEPRDMLFRKMKQLLFRANLPHVTTNLFERLRITARDTPGVLDRVNLSIQFTPRIGRLTLPRARDRSKWKEGLSTVEGLPEGKAKRKRNKRTRNQTTKIVETPLVRITMNTPRNLRTFFDDSYVPLRLPESSKKTIGKYHVSIERLSQYLAYDATFESLSDDNVERFLAWTKKVHSLSNSSVNGCRRVLLSLWRHAFRKRKIDEVPRDIPKMREAKRIPEAWSLDELALILKAASETEGEVCGISAGLFWPALILALYYSGLRIDALMRASSNAFDVDSRWLKIPAEDQKQNADQVFRLPPEAVMAIASTNPSERDLLFPWEFDQSGGHGVLNRHYRKILKAAGLSAGRRDLFHKLRRTSATAVCQELGEEGARLHLGHSDVEVTRRYIDPRQLTGGQSASELIRRVAVPALLEFPRLISEGITS